MEVLKRDKKQHRRLFTRACNDFEENQLSMTDSEKILKLRIIEEKALLMIQSEEKFKQLLYAENVSETEIDEQIDESEIYIDRWRSLKQKLESLSREQVLLKNESYSVLNNNATQQNTLLHYPKIKLPTYDGNIRNWLHFWGQFQKIDEDVTLDFHDKFAYLSQAMEKGSPADELVKSFPPGGNSYEKALKQLKMRFGREELLIQVYVRDLLALVLQKQNSSNYCLRKLFDQLESKLRSLELLGVTREKYASMLFPLVESALPETTLVAWERYRSARRRVRDLNIDDADESKIVTEKSDLESILEFLQDEVEAEERISLASQSFINSKSRANLQLRNKAFQDKKEVKSRTKFGDFASIPSATDLLTSTQEQRQCIFCKYSHPSGECIKARKMSMKDREELVQKSKCCFLCLKPGHLVRKCNFKANCLCCGKKHHILLCRNMRQVASDNIKDSSYEGKKNSTPSEIDHALSNVSTTPNVMLQTFKVLIRGNGTKRAVRAIIDTASQRSYLLRDTALEMKYKPESYEYLQHSLFGGSNTGVCKHDVYTLYLSSIHGNYNCNFKVLSQQVICESVPLVANKLYFEELADYDINFEDNNQDPIEILIGADVAGKLLTGRRQELFCGLVAIETKLGWTVMGRITDFSVRKNASLVVTSMLSTVSSITDLWNLDTLGITDPSVKKSQTELQEAAKEHFLNSVRVENDRFVVDLPWLEDHPPLPNYYELALRRLDTTVKRLKSESLYNSYEEVFNEWLKEGVIEEIGEKEEQIQGLYLPHRAVVKDNSTTKIRPVFDASAKIKGYPSLNDCLEKGPNLIENIPSILTRFRKEKIGVIADIRKAFLQISLSPADRNYLKFLWINSEGKLKVYRHCRVVFGVSCSPFLLGSTIQFHLQAVLEKIHHAESTYPKNVIQQLMSSFYVDNCVTSVKSERKLNLFIKVSSEVMFERKFELRGWEHTDSNAKESIDSKVLGLLWNRKSDTLRINTATVKEMCFEKVTKRTILSAAHRLFDPLGLTSPVILTPKLLLQEIWKTKKTWDEEIDFNTRNKFLRWIRDISYLDEIHFPRYFGSETMVEKTSIHFFCDASKLAYAVAAFIRIETSDSVKVQLLQARSRVAPTGNKEITISRLELLAATIASRLSSTILSDIHCKEVYFWTDSSTVLAWITREEAWNVFVQNRVKEIRSLTDRKAWRHVPGSMNPADLPSRGCSAQFLLKSKWWLGPRWLYLAREDWPVSDFGFDENEVVKEKKKSVVSIVAKCLLLSVVSRDWYYRYFSKYRKLVNLMAWILRFIFNCQSKRTDRKRGNLDSKEILEAEKRIVKMVQEDCFINEQDDKLKTLRPFKDKNGIIRLKTKLTFRQDDDDFIMPAILPSKHEVVKRLIHYYHEKHAHAGTQMLINILRDKFWILNARKTVRSVIYKCTVCKRHLSKNLDAQTAPLPENRVCEAAVFEICGIDFAGPVILRENKKSWICIFTCAVYRAVHFELASSISTESFLQALRRFIARRGRCKLIYCDNGSNFVGAFNMLRDLDWNRIIDDTALTAIEWKFNPPTASWWGGWWERLIGILKKLLRRVLGRASLTYEEMVTVLCDCESVINSRPLTYMAENDASLIPLSPALFLQDLQTSGVPDIDAAGHESLNKRIKYRQNLRKDLRQRFRSEYLGGLIQRAESKKSMEVTVGDVVLVGTDHTKRINWPLGRIIEIIPGRDGIARLVKLQTAKGELLRPIQRLYPLEVSIRDPIVNKFPPGNVMDETSNCSVSGEEFQTSLQPHVKQTQSGRRVKVPQRLDL